MKTRILTAAAALTAFIPFLYFSHTPAFPALAAVLGGVAVWELYSCVGETKRYNLTRIMSLILAAILPFAARYRQSLIFPGVLAYILVVFAAFVLDAELVDKGKKGGQVYFAGFESLAVVLGFSLLIAVRDREPLRYLLIFIAAWATDTFAYFFGVAFGKKKLCPVVSPKKTVAGGVWGVLGCGVSFVVFGLVCNGFFNKSYSILTLAVLSVVFSIVGQTGDLAASAVKRRLGVKDFGRLFPGHGGVLDRFDSIIAITLAAYIFTELEKLW